MKLKAKASALSRVLIEELYKLEGAYGAIIETKQPNSAQYAPSENLKTQLDSLIRIALAAHPPVIRTVP